MPEPLSDTVFSKRLERLVELADTLVAVVSESTIPLYFNEAVRLASDRASSTARDMKFGLNYGRSKGLLVVDDHGYVNLGVASQDVLPGAPAGRASSLVSAVVARAVPAAARAGYRPPEPAEVLRLARLSQTLVAVIREGGDQMDPIRAVRNTVESTDATIDDVEQALLFAHANDLVQLTVSVPARAVEPAPDDTDPMAAAWHAASDHAEDGAAFGSFTCNCARIAERAKKLGWSPAG